jgi:hypothetical protein
VDVPLGDHLCDESDDPNIACAFPCSLLSCSWTGDDVEYCRSLVGDSQHSIYDNWTPSDARQEDWIALDFGGAINPPDFADIPMGAFLGAGDDLPGPYVAWDARDPRAVVDFNGTAPFPLALAFHAPQQVNVAPVFACGGAAGAIALLGQLHQRARQVAGYEVDKDPHPSTSVCASGSVSA